MSIKKTIFILVAVLSFLLINSHPALALNGATQDIAQQLGAAAGAQGAGLDAPKDPRIIVGQIIQAFLGLLGMIFICLTLYAGFLWMTAGGNEDQVTQSKTLLTQATIGLIIMLLSYGITSLAFRIALGQGIVTNSWWIAPSYGPQQ